MERIIVQYRNADNKILWSEIHEITLDYDVASWIDELKDKIRGGINFGATHIALVAYSGCDLIWERLLVVSAI